MTKNGFFHFERKQRTPGKVPDKVTRHSLHCSYYPRLKQLAAFWEPWSILEETLLWFSSLRRKDKPRGKTAWKVYLLHSSFEKESL